MFVSFQRCIQKIPVNIVRWSFFRKLLKVVNYFQEKLRLRYLTGYWICLLFKGILLFSLRPRTQANTKVHWCGLATTYVVNLIVCWSSLLALLHVGCLLKFLLYSFLSKNVWTMLNDLCVEKVCFAYCNGLLERSLYFQIAWSDELLFTSNRTWNKQKSFSHHLTKRFN